MKFPRLCSVCGGRGKRCYASTSTWKPGIGGQVITEDVCDECWGSGDLDNKWTNLKVLRRILTVEQVKLYREAVIEIEKSEANSQKEVGE